MNGGIGRIITHDDMTTLLQVGLDFQTKEKK